MSDFPNKQESTVEERIAEQDEVLPEEPFQDDVLEEDEMSEPDEASDDDVGDDEGVQSDVLEGYDMEHLFDSWDPYGSDRNKKRISDLPGIGTAYSHYLESDSYAKKRSMSSFERQHRQFKISVAIALAFVFVMAIGATSFFSSSVKTFENQNAHLKEQSQADIENLYASESATAGASISNLQAKKETVTITVNTPENIRDEKAELVVKGTSATGEAINRIYHVPLNEPKEISMMQGVYVFSFTYALKDTSGKNYACPQVEEVVVDSSGKELFFEYVPV